MQARMIRIGPALILLLGTVACSHTQVLRVSLDMDSADQRAAVMECCLAAGLRPHEEMDLEMDAMHGSYGQRIRNDPELLEIFRDEFSEVRVFAREGRYELDVESSSSYENPAAQIERCLRENIPDAQ